MLAGRCWAPCPQCQPQRQGRRARDALGQV